MPAVTGLHRGLLPPAKILPNQPTKGKVNEMDEDDFEKSRDEASVENTGDHPHLTTHRDFPLPSSGQRDSAGNRITRDAKTNKPGIRPDIVWVRASDLLSTGTGRIASRGISLETDLSRRMKRAPTAARRALRTRAERLPALTEFGRSTGNPPLFWYRLLRR